jgi:hypothetical protein
MGAQESGLTLEGLAQRLEALERENAGLREEVAALRGSGEDGVVVEAAWASEGRVSRRALFGKAGAAAVAAVAAGTLLYPRGAKAHVLEDPPTQPQNISTHFISVTNHVDAFAAVRATATSNTEGTVESNNLGSGPGVRGNNANGTGVHGEGSIGVHGQTGITGHGAVYGEHTGGQGYGVVGDGNGNASAGVLGRNFGGQGVRGEGSIGVHGQTGVNGNGAVYGEHTGTDGPGVVGDGKGTAAAGVLGRNGTGQGVRGIGKLGVWGSQPP